MPLSVPSLPIEATLAAKEVSPCFSRSQAPVLPPVVMKPWNFDLNSCAVRSDTGAT